MAYLTLRRKQLFKVGIPLWVFVNEQPVGIMRGKEATVQLPEGRFTVSVRIIFQILKWRFHIGGSTDVEIQSEDHRILAISDNERFWNILFDIDIVLWMARFFYTLPSPWDTVYEIISNGFFLVWILRIWMIRNRYFKLN